MRAPKNENKKSARKVEKPTYGKDLGPWCQFEESEMQNPEKYYRN